MDSDLPQDPTRILMNPIDEKTERDREEPRRLSFYFRAVRAISDFFFLR